MSERRVVVPRNAQNRLIARDLFLRWYTNAAYRGGKALEAYMRHGSGIFLLQAYLKSRRAVQKETKTRKENNLITLLTAPPLRAKWNAAIDELVMFNVLDELDPIIRDLLKNCEDQGEDQGVGGDPLKALRGVLRIGRGRSFSDVAKITRRQLVVGYWVSAYRTMDYSETLKSERVIADEIAKEVGISRRTAFNYWQQEKKSRPSIGSYAKETRDRIQSAANIERSANAGRTLKSSDRRRIVYGRQRRAND
jgi:hypothetical protein